ncbi:MAG: TadG family pilus assembly protein [Gemmataceae bacterium]
MLHRPIPISRRRGAVVVLVALLLVFLMLVAAFAIDLGYIGLVRNQLQVAADGAALAAAADMSISLTAGRTAAKDIATRNVAGGTTDAVTMVDSDIEFGTWNTGSRTFTAGTASVNAVRVTARKSLPLFFGRVIGFDKRDVQASAIAVTNPRDIAFIIDLSGSMNNDSEIWATNAINGAFNGYPTIGTDIMAQVFTDFGFGSYPGTTKHIGEGYIPSNQLNNNAYYYLANTYLKQASIPTTYRTSGTWNTAANKTQVYKWIIDTQLATLMPKAKPVPSSSNSASYQYWKDYLDYVINGGSNSPPSQKSYQMDTASNPYPDAWPTLTSSTITPYLNKVGYQTYVQFMMDFGWNRQAGGQYTQISRESPNCPWKIDTDPSSPGYGLSFPPREQPTHAVRLAVMAGINRIAEINAGLPETTKDHVCVIAFDTAPGTADPRAIRYPLTATSCDYAAARASVRDLQAVADDTMSTASENGMILARNHLDPAQNPSGARTNSNKLLIFLSDGIPNIKQSSNTTIDNFINNNKTGEWFTSGSYEYERNAVLMQITQLQALGWRTHSVGVGLGADRTLMDRMSRMAGTALPDPDNPTGPKISPYADGNPADYQTRLTSIFNNIVASPNIRLVK